MVKISKKSERWPKGSL